MNPAPPDERRFLELIEENRPKILRICRVYAWNPEDQDDLYQEILFQVWRGLPGLKTEAHAGTWLYRVALNSSISFVRKRAARKNRVIPVDHEELARQIEARQTVEPGGNDRLARLRDAIGLLNDVEKALVTMFLEDLSYDQIGEVLGISAGNVGVMLHRAKKKLSALMKEGPHE